MKAKVLMVIVICMPFFLKAQITLTSQLPKGGMLLKDQLWNLVITNNTNDIAELTLQLDIRDVLLGQSVLNASSGKIFIGKGMRLITVKDAQPILYNYMDNEISGNYLPCGSYVINYHLIAETSKGDIIPVADEITKINITPLSPPLLTAPVDGASMETVYPQFTWVPPTPVQMFDPLLYDITIVAIEEGQSPNEAIEFNQPVFINTNLTNPAEKMPGSFEQLRKGRSYAWQVVARSGMRCSVATDVWMFTIKDETYIKDSSKNSYVLLNSVGEEKEVFSVKGNGLRLKYYSFTKEHTGEIRLMSSDRKVLQQASQKILYGNNFLSIKLNKRFEKGQIFIVELTTSDAKKPSALFRISE